MTTAAAFFDLDRTLISGASAFPLGIEAWRQGLASNQEVLRWALAALSFKALGDKGDVISEDVRSDFLSHITNTSVEDLEALTASVVPRLLSRVRPESRKLITMHRDHGRDTWIVSASPQSIVQPLADDLGMTGAVGTRGEIADGRYTGRIDGSFVYGAGKAESIEKLASDRGYDLALSYAYSDSISDLPMMELVGHPVAVNPDSELGSISHERGWPVVIFAKRTKQALAFSGVGLGTAAATSLAYLLGRRHGRSSTLAQMTLKKLGMGK